MRVTLRLLQNNTRLTLFTRANCSLCDTAKDVLKRVKDARSISYEEIDVMQHQRWKDLYEFDAPVLHIEPTSNSYVTKNACYNVRKLMHRFSEQDVKSLIEQTETEANSFSSE